MSTDPTRRSSNRRARTRDARAEMGATGDSYARAAGDRVADLQPGRVRIRLEADSVEAVDAHEAALRRVLLLDEQSRPDPNRRGVGVRRYLDSDGVRPVAAGQADAEPSPLA